MRKLITLSILLLGLLVYMPADAQNNKKKKKKKKGQVEQPKKKKDDKDVLKKCEKIDGLFTLYRDTTSGAMYMAIDKDQIGKEYIYFSYTENGVLPAGHFRGAYRENKIFKIRKYYEKIEFVTQNTRYYFDEDNALSKAAHANISEGIMLSEKIVQQDKDSTAYILNANNIFLGQAMHQIQPTPPTKPRPGAFRLGQLSKSKTKFSNVKNYEENTDIVVDYVFESKVRSRGAGDEVTDSRNITVKVQHSIIEVPDNNFKPRFDDPRVGYFMHPVTDMTSTDPAPYRDLIHRWHLEKKDPDAALSEPVEPITWWIENTTPQEFRETIRQAVLKWNIAFEQAGFKNAVVVKVQPDDADWDAGDIRYNVLRWTSSPVPPFGGYGPSFVNPRTGQILGADVMLEYVFIKSDLVQDHIYTLGMEGEDTAHLDHHDCGYSCNLSALMQNNVQAGLAYAKALGATKAEESELIKESLTYLLLHEVGHTLGLNHNMKATNLHSPSEAHNKAVTADVGLYGSVMDYPMINVALDKSKQGEYFGTTPGPYDKWAIEFGYSEPKGRESQASHLNKILSRSADPQLTFGNDADDMRSPGKGIDPRVMIFDMSDDPITYGIERVKLVRKILPELKKKFVTDGESYQYLRTAYLFTTSQHFSSMNNISRFIGGIYVDRAMAGQDGATQPFTPVSYREQKRAMKALSDYLFAPDAFKVSADLYKYLTRQRRGFNFWSQREDPDIHSRALRFQKAALAHLLHSKTLQRMTDTRMYGNQYSVYEMLGDLTNATFNADIEGDVNTFRQNLQIYYIKSLIAAMSSKTHDYIAKTAALEQLNSIDTMLTANAGSGETKAHRSHIRYLIEQALDKD